MSATTADAVHALPAPEPSLTPARMVERARLLIPLVREQQQEAELHGRHSEAVHEALRDAGIYRITQPRRFGGYGFDLPTFLGAMVHVATGDPGTGWCVTLASSHAWLVASHFDLETQAEAFGPHGDFRCPHPAAPTGELTRAEGGYRLTGRWPYASGIPYATWALGGAMLVGEGEPQRQVVLIPRQDMTVLDDWGDGRMLGLNSSGSNTFVVDGAFVPERRVVAHGDFFDPGMPTVGTRAHGNPLYVGRPWGPYHASLVAPIVGAARAALDEFRDLIMVKPTSFPPQIPRYAFHEDQRAYGLGRAKADAAAKVLFGFAEEYMDAAQRSMASGDPIAPVQDGRWWTLVQQAGGLAAEAVETVAHRSTSSSTGRGTRLGRYVRDVTTYRQHISAQQGDFAIRTAALELGAPTPWV